MLSDIDIDNLARIISDYALIKGSHVTDGEIREVLERNRLKYPSKPYFIPYAKTSHARRRINYTQEEKETLDMLIRVAKYEAKKRDCQWANRIMVTLNYAYYPNCNRFRQRTEDLLARLRRSDRSFMRRRRQRHVESTHAENNDQRQIDVFGHAMNWNSENRTEQPSTNSDSLWNTSSTLTWEDPLFFSNYSMNELSQRTLLLTPTIAEVVGDESGAVDVGSDFLERTFEVYPSEYDLDTYSDMLM